MFRTLFYNSCWGYRDPLPSQPLFQRTYNFTIIFPLTRTPLPITHSPITHLKASTAHMHPSPERCHLHRALASPAPPLHRRRPGHRHLHRLLQPNTLPCTISQATHLHRTPRQRPSVAFRFVRIRKVQCHLFPWPPLPPPLGNWVRWSCVQ